MKIVILAGGVGSRLSEETALKPKPMVEIGGRPILWHIMRRYASFGFREFVIALGYRGVIIKDYFAEYRRRAADLTISLRSGAVDVHNADCEDWVVHLVDTGEQTQTGGRIRRLRNHLGTAPFMLTYGDGLADVDFTELLKFHRSHGRLATVTAVRPPSRFGGLVLQDGLVTSFEEKPQVGEGWINGGFFVLEPAVLDYIENDSTIWERQPLEQLASDGQLAAYRHEGFWQCMDTLRDLKYLENRWQEQNAPWIV